MMNRLLALHLQYVPITGGYLISYQEILSTRGNGSAIFKKRSKISMASKSR